MLSKNYFIKSCMKSNDLYFYGNCAELELHGSRGLYYQEFYYLSEVHPLFLICLSHCAARNLLSVSCTQNNLSIYFKLCGFLSEQVINYLANFESMHLFCYIAKGSESVQ